MIAIVPPRSISIDLHSKMVPHHADAAPDHRNVLLGVGPVDSGVESVWWRCLVRMALRGHNGAVLALQGLQEGDEANTFSRGRSLRWTAKDCSTV